MVKQHAHQHITEHQTDPMLGHYCYLDQYTILRPSQRNSLCIVSPVHACCSAGIQAGAALKLLLVAATLNLDGSETTKH